MERHDKPAPPVELLAPAGSRAAFVAAVNNGADAVYVGLRELNARRGAENFDLPGLADAAAFAHLRGVRVYLTANVVVVPEELQAALTLVDDAWAAGVDAVIVQDLGLLRAIRRHLPHVRIHASTQIGASNVPTVAALGGMGVARVTLARECSLAEIATMCSAADVEIEAFTHGALCVCYSGHCLLSSMIGRRSANRGMCAQPCRLPYTLTDRAGGRIEAPGDYLLSPRDLAGIAHLPELIGAGVRALKIEGRMKAPEYVGVTVGVYRKALDRAYADPEGFEVTSAEWEALDESFNRGFTDGYLRGESGDSLMAYRRPNNRGVLLGRIVASDGATARVRLERGVQPEDTIEVWTRSGRFAQAAGRLRVDGGDVTFAPSGSTAELTLERPAGDGDRVFRVANAALISAARRTFTGAAEHEYRAVPLEMRVTLRTGRPLELEARCADGTAVTVSGDPVERARTKPITLDEVIAHVGRMGGSGYRVERWDVELEPGVGLGFSALHRLRRDALEALDAVRLEPWSARARFGPRIDMPRRRGHPDSVAPRVVASAWERSVAEACAEAGADEVLLRVSAADAATELPRGIRPLLPRIVRVAEVAQLRGWLTGPVTAGELGMVREAAERGVPVDADWTLNVTNPASAEALAELGVSRVCASPELNEGQLTELVTASPVPVGTLVYGRVELMVTEHCVLSTGAACSGACDACTRRDGWWRLTDAKGYSFPVTTDATGRSHLVNSVTLDLTRVLTDVIACGVAEIRMELTDETPERAASIVRGMRAALTDAMRGVPAASPLVQPATSGHFRRGVL